MSTDASGPGGRVAQIAVHLVYGVPGVVQVTDRLEYDFDDIRLVGTGLTT